MPSGAHNLPPRSDLQCDFLNAPRRFSINPGNSLIDGERVTFDRHECIREFCYLAIVIGNSAVSYCTATYEHPRANMHSKKFALVRNVERPHSWSAGDQHAHGLADRRKVILVQAHPGLPPKPQ